MSHNFAASVYDVRCRGCGRRIAVAPSKAYLTIYCSEICSLENEPAFTNEERDSLMEQLSLGGRSDTQISALFNVTRARVQQIIASRQIPYQDRPPKRNK